MWIDSNLYGVIKSVIPVVCVDCIIEHDNKILLIRRNDEPAKNQWWFPGGRVYKNEYLENCAIRKCKEEVGLNCEVVKQILVSETIFDSIHTVNVVYHMQSDSDKAIIDHTISDYMWINLSDYYLEILRCNPYIENALHKFLIDKRIKMPDCKNCHADSSHVVFDQIKIINKIKYYIWYCMKCLEKFHD